MVTGEALFDKLTEGLPGLLTDRIRVVRDAARLATKTYRREDGVEITPRFEIICRMFAERPKVVQVILEQWKPQPGKRVLAEISGEHFEALNTQLSKLEMSWEHYFETVVHNG